MASEKMKRNVETKTLEVGQAVTGRYLGKSAQEVPDRDTGELKQREKLIFLNVSKTPAGGYSDDVTGSRFALWSDAGLRASFADALIQEREVVEITRLEQKELSGGRRMNQYDIFSYS